MTKQMKIRGIASLQLPNLIGYGIRSVESQSNGSFVVNLFPIHMEDKEARHFKLIFFHAALRRADFSCDPYFSELVGIKESAQSSNLGRHTIEFDLRSGLIVIDYESMCTYEFSVYVLNPS